MIPLRPGRACICQSGSFLGSQPTLVFLWEKIHKHRPQIAMHPAVKHPKLHAPCALPSISQKCACTEILRAPQTAPAQTPSHTPNSIPKRHLQNPKLHAPLHPTVKMQKCACTVTCMPDSTQASISQIAPAPSPAPQTAPQTASQNTTSTSTPNCMPPCTLPSRCKSTCAPSPPKQHLHQHPQTACPLAPYRQS